MKAEVPRFAVAITRVTRRGAAFGHELDSQGGLHPAPLQPIHDPVWCLTICTVHMCRTIGERREAEGARERPPDNQPLATPCLVL